MKKARGHRNFKKTQVQKTKDMKTRGAISLVATAEKAQHKNTRLQPEILKLLHETNCLNGLLSVTNQS